MNWQIFFLITYGFILGLIMLVLSFYLYSRWIRRQTSAAMKASALSASSPIMSGDTRKIDFQQIERLVRLHQDVKDDLSNYGDVLVAMRNEQLTARAHQQKQIDICLSFIENEQKQQQQAEEAKQQQAEAAKQQQAEAAKQQQDRSLRHESEGKMTERSIQGDQRYKAAPSSDRSLGTSENQDKAVSDLSSGAQPARRASWYQRSQAEVPVEGKKGSFQSQIETDDEKHSQRRAKAGENQQFKRRAVSGETSRDQVMKLIRFGMEPDQISQKTGLSRGEIDLMISLRPQEA